MRISSWSERAAVRSGWNAWADFWRRLHARRARWPVVTIGAIGLSGDELGRVRTTLARLSEQLCLSLELRGADAQILLVGARSLQDSSASEFEIQAQGRPVVTLPPPAGTDAAPPWADVDGARMHHALLRQLMDLPIVRRQSRQWSASGWPRDLTQPMLSAIDGDASPGSDAALGDAADADPWHVEPLQGPVRWFVHAFREGLRQMPDQPIEASFGEGASLRVDFAQRAVRIDAPALKALRVQRRLPHLAPGWMPSADAYRHDLEDIAWDVGLACGRAGWFDAPADPWLQPLIGVAVSHMGRFTRQDKHLALARELQAGPLTPAQLLQRVQIGVPALRRVIQACLLLGLVRWSA
ncbi:MAG: hypothetical protein U1E89_21885 [Burkholderiaceae bacterium]